MSADRRPAGEYADDALVAEMCVPAEARANGQPRRGTPIEAAAGDSRRRSFCIPRLDDAHFVLKGWAHVNGLRSTVSHGSDASAPHAEGFLSFSEKPR